MTRMQPAVLLLLLSCSLLAFPQSVNTTVEPLPQNLSKHAVHSGAMVNVVTDCGAVGDGVNDDWSTIQACINDNPGKTIFFPKMRSAPCTTSGSGGACIGSVDYYVSRTLKLSGNAQALMGGSPSRWPAGAVQIKFPRDLNGPGIWIPSGVSSGYIGNLLLNGQRCWNPVDLTAFDEPASLTGVGPDGVLLTGGEPSVYGVTAYCFGRHGFAVLGDNAEGEARMGQPDFWSIQNSFATGNRGYGLYVNGGDSNAGESIALKTTGNQLGGIYDHSVLGNTHISPASHMDNRNPVVAGPQHPITSISVENGLCNLTMQSAEKELSTKGTWITVSGTSGGLGFDGTYRLGAPKAASQNLSYRCNASGGPAKGGTVASASSTEVYALYHSKEIPTGSYLGRGGSSISVWINPYCELNSNAPNFNTSSIVIGRGCEDNVRGDRTWIGWQPGPGWGSTMRVGQGLVLDNASDTMNWLTIAAGRTTEQDKGIHFAGVNRKNHWDLGQAKAGSLYVRDLESKGFLSFVLNSGGTTDISAPNNSAVRLGRGSAGGVQFFGGPTEVANVDGGGKATFNGVCLSAQTCWSTGKGAPPATSCARGKGGSLYTRSDGGPSTSLYVCDGSNGTWLAK
jgi:hypothetical protein